VSKIAQTPSLRSEHNAKADVMKIVMNLNFKVVRCPKCWASTRAPCQSA